MNDKEQTCGQQAAQWNGDAGYAWVEQQPLLQRLFAPFSRALVDDVVAAGARDVLDIGCGCGDTTLAIAQALPAGSRCTGIDISSPMVERARARAAVMGAAADFVCADAERYRFPERAHGAGHDALVSRFGAMFFDQASVAFANLRTAMRAGAPLHLFAWRSAEENPFMTCAERAVAGRLGLPTNARDARAPGQFAFADGEWVADVLAGVGWCDVRIAARDVLCEMSRTELNAYLGAMGPVGRALRRADPALRADVLRVLEQAFSGFVEGERVRFVAACWKISARNQPVSGDQ